MGRPKTLVEIAQQARTDAPAIDRAVREFLDGWQSMDREQRRRALAEEPDAIGSLQDAYLAALAEHLSLKEGQIGPAWSEKPGRFLREPYFAGGLESLKAILLVQSPLAFRRRLIFISADGLFRPNRTGVKETSGGR